MLNWRAKKVPLPFYSATTTMLPQLVIYWYPPVANSIKVTYDKHCQTSEERMSKGMASLSRGNRGARYNSRSRRHSVALMTIGLTLVMINYPRWEPKAHSTHCKTTYSSTSKTLKINIKRMKRNASETNRQPSRPSCRKSVKCRMRENAFKRQRIRMSLTCSSCTSASTCSEIK